MQDYLILGDKKFKSRFILGSGKYSHELINSAITQGECEMITLALRRVGESKDRNILDFIPKNITLLPNTSGARNADEAVRIAKLSKELGCGNFIKIEIIKDTKFLFPDNYETIRATQILSDLGFVVMPYIFGDLQVARELKNAGAACIMPLGSPIGSNQGLVFKNIIEILINEVDLPVIVDAGIGKPSQACEAMELGASAIMANTAIATSKDIPFMAKAFKEAINAGRNAFLSGLGRVKNSGEASSPLTGFLGD